MKLLFVLSALLLSQAVVSFQAAPNAGQPYGNATDDPEWKFIAHDGFSAQIPDSSFDTWSADKKDLKYKMFSAQTIKAWYYVSAFDKLKHSPMETLLRFAADKDTTVSDVTVDGVPGKGITFSEFETLRHEILAFTVQDRTFIFHAVRKSEDRSETDRFFGSVKLDLQKVETDATPQYLALLVSSILGESKTDQPEEEPLLRVQRIPGSSQDPEGSGSGSGSTSQREEQITGETPLKILSSARPGYTDLARKYNLSGRVVLRVTFLADGTVGAVSVASALPMGLTDNAIRAAKQIRFEPASRKGRAYAVNKPVHYNFTIY